jgi:hypothetical protein
VIHLPTSREDAPFGGTGSTGVVALRRTITRRARVGWRRALATIALLGVACAVGAAVTVVSPSLLLVGLVALLLIAVVAVHPPTAAYVLIGVTPLVAGMDRGLVIPLLRPNEALLVLVATGLVTRGVVRAAGAGSLPELAFGATDRSILLLAFTSSVLPLAWMAARGQPIAQDDLLYALMVWKYYGVYLVARCSVGTERQLRNCLWVAMVSASVVAIVAILQSLKLFGVPYLLSRYFAPYGSAEALLNNRGGSTLALPIAVADLLTFNLAIAVGFLARGRGHRGALLVMGVLFVAGVLSSGEFSGATGMLLGVLTIALVLRRVRPLAAFVPAFIAAAWALQPVIERRLQGFGSASGLPVSWTGRLHNLTSYFWPVLFSHGNVILGVRPAARVATATMATGYIWIESGYTWLLWAGGIPLLLAFLYFLRANLRQHLALARLRDDALGVAALAVSVALVVIGVLMVLDPHLTYRGSADLLFVLIGLADGARRRLPQTEPAKEHDADAR